MAAENEEEAMDVEEEYIPEGGIRIGDIYIPPPPLPAPRLGNSDGSKVLGPEPRLPSLQQKQVL